MSGQLNLVQKKLKESFKDKVILNHKLANLSYFKTGGIARNIILIENENFLNDVLHYLHQWGMEYLCLGKATNVLINDNPIEKVILMSSVNNISSYNKVKENEISFLSGLALLKAMKISHKYLLKGLEFLSGVPGSIGGAVKMNAGTKDGEVKDILKEIIIVRNDQVQSIKQEDLNFAYRYSNIQAKEFVFSATFKLKKVEKEEIKQVKAKNLKDLQKRKASQPLLANSFGSTFKNPLQHYAAKLIEECNLKGKRIGNVEVSEKHANFLINLGKGTTKEAIELINIIQEKVYKKTNILLNREVIYFGF